MIILFKLEYQILLKLSAIRFIPAKKNGGRYHYRG
jgi:hypothetical protein